jgi:trimeric autotransporter adhesin
MTYRNGRTTIAGKKLCSDFVFLRSIRFFALLALGFLQTASAAEVITTIVGGEGDGGPAQSSTIAQPWGLTFDASGNLYLADSYTGRIRRVNGSGMITTIVGTTQGFSGDGDSSLFAQLAMPKTMALDKNGNLYIADHQNHRIRKVSTAGIISTVAGNGTAGFSGDGGPATSATLNGPFGVAVDSQGNIFIGDTSNHRLRKVRTDGIITTVAGNGVVGYSGDGTLGTQTSLNRPMGIVFDSAGNLYIGDCTNRRLRKLTPAGIISTVAGNGSTGFSGDGGLAISASFRNVMDVAIDGAGNLYIADFGNHRIRKVSTSGIVTTVAGNGVAGYSGNGGSATSASLNKPTGVAVDSAGNLYISDSENHQIRKVSSGIINAIAGNGSRNGDGGLAARARLDEPYALIEDTVGNLYICDRWQHVVRKVSASTGVITTIAGISGTMGFSGDGGPATAAMLAAPWDMAFDASGNLYIVDALNNRIRKINSSGIITTVAGNGTILGGDGGPATSAGLFNPYGVAIDPAGQMYIADSLSHCIRKVNTSGIISTIAGTALVSGSTGDGGLAKNAKLRQPYIVRLDSNGNLFVLDSFNSKVRKIDPSGVITRVAGSGKDFVDNIGFSGDGGQATSAMLYYPFGLSLDNLGNIFIADTGNNCIRKVNSSGIITRVAGLGPDNGQFSGDGGDPKLAGICGPFGVYVSPSGSHYYVVDTGNRRIRKVQTETSAAVNQPPLVTSALARTPNPAAVGGSVKFSVGASDPEGGALSYLWNFGDGGTSTAASPSHSYSSVGTYSVSVTVKDAANGSAMATTTIKIVPGLSVTATDASATETGDKATFKITRTGSTVAALNVSYKMGGTALNGGDYQSLSGSVSIPAGSSSTTVTLSPLNDTFVEGTEKATISLVATSLYKISTGSATVSIYDDERPEVRVSASDAKAYELDLNVGKFTITCIPAAKSKLTVNYTLSGTATNGIDYSTLPVSVAIPAGGITATVTLIPINDSKIEVNESAILTLSNHSSYQTSSPSNAVITILSDE